MHLRCTVQGGGCTYGHVSTAPSRTYDESFGLLGRCARLPNVVLQHRDGSRLRFAVLAGRRVAHEHDAMRYSRQRVRPVQLRIWNIAPMIIARLTAPWLYSSHSLYRSQEQTADCSLHRSGNGYNPRVGLTYVRTRYGPQFSFSRCRAGRGRRVRRGSRVRAWV